MPDLRQGIHGFLRLKKANGRRNPQKKILKKNALETKKERRRNLAN